MGVLDGMAALVTGASKGVGKGIALELAREGCNVAVNYHGDAAGASKTVAEIEAIGRRAFAVQADVGKSGEVAAMFAMQPLSHWDPLLTEADCCYQAVIGYDQVPDHPHVRARGLVGRLGNDTEVLLPVFVDGEPPQQREEVRFVDPDTVLAAWPGD